MLEVVHKMSDIAIVWYSINRSLGRRKREPYRNETFCRGGDVRFEDIADCCGRSVNAVVVYAKREPLIMYSSKGVIVAPLVD